MDKVMIVASEQNISLFETLERAREFQIKGYEVLGDFVLMIRSFQTMLKKPAYDVAMHVAKQTGLLKALYEDKTVEGIARYENIEELLNGLKEFSVDDSVDEDGVQKYGILEEYMADIALLTDSDKEDPNDNDRVTMMTIHASKGLEFKNVFIVGLEENLFPSQLSLNSRQELEEERRLFYVAITRAMNKLTLSFATSRFKFGNITNAEPSRFLSELDPKFLQFDALFSKGNSAVQSKPTVQTSRFGKPLSPTAKTPPSTVGQRFNTPTKPAAAPPPAVDPNFVGDDTKNIQVQQRVEHQRFGFGTVVTLDGVGDNRKAEIEFEQFGKKMIVLKFAKLKLL
jgi:DNA helicase-2/ATP-dependent DNA helicase PcrA